MSRIDEDFELELRALPGVLNVGFERSSAGEVNAVTLVVSGSSRNETEGVALQISSLYYPDAKVLVEDVARANAPAPAGRSRAALVRAEYDPDARTCVVELHLAGRVGIARAQGSALEGGVEATLEALRELGINVPYSLVSVSNMITVRSWPVVVVLRSLINGSDRFGVAQSDSDVTAAVKATLSAVNRLPRDDTGRETSS